MNPSAHQSLRDDKDGTREYSSRPEALNLASRTGRIYDSNLSLHQCPEPCKRGGDHIRIHGGSWAPRPNLPKVPAAQQSSEERLGVSDNPGHWNLPSERVCVLPFRDPGEQDVRQGAYRDVFTAFPEGQNTEPRPRLEKPIAMKQKSPARRPGFSIGPVTAAIRTRNAPRPAPSGCRCHPRWRLCGRRYGAGCA